MNQQNQAKLPSAKDNAPQSQLAEILSFTKTIALFLAVAFFLRASVVEAFKIPSSSMENTLQIGDHILVNKLSYGFRLPFVDKAVSQFSQPDRGDVVVFTLPDDPSTPEIDESETNIIKRVIGLPGDRIEVRGTQVLINGKPYLDDEKYSVWAEGGIKSFGPDVVPEGRVLLLGDNRDHSKDSRYWKDHYLEISRIKGRAFVIYWNSGFRLGRMFTLIR